MRIHRSRAEIRADSSTIPQKIWTCKEVHYVVFGSSQLTDGGRHARKVAGGCTHLGDLRCKGLLLHLHHLQLRQLVRLQLLDGIWCTLHVHQRIAHVLLKV